MQDTTTEKDLKHMPRLYKRSYQLTIEDNGSDDHDITVTLTDLEGKLRTRTCIESLVPALNQIKQTLADDFENGN